MQPSPRPGACGSPSRCSGCHRDARGRGHPRPTSDLHPRGLHRLDERSREWDGPGLAGLRVLGLHRECAPAQIDRAPLEPTNLALPHAGCERAHKECTELRDYIALAVLRDDQGLEESVFADGRCEVGYLLLRVRAPVTSVGWEPAETCEYARIRLSWCFPRGCVMRNRCLVERSTPSRSRRRGRLQLRCMALRVISCVSTAKKKRLQAISDITRQRPNDAFGTQSPKPTVAAVTILK
jgi:hypothetical protein